MRDHITWWGKRQRMTIAGRGLCSYPALWLGGLLRKLTGNGNKPKITHPRKKVDPVLVERERYLTGGLLTGSTSVYSSLCQLVPFVTPCPIYLSEGRRTSLQRYPVDQIQLLQALSHHTRKKNRRPASREGWFGILWMDPNLNARAFDSRKMPVGHAIQQGTGVLQTGRRDTIVPCAMHNVRYLWGHGVYMLTAQQCITTSCTNVE